MRQCKALLYPDLPWGAPPEWKSKQQRGRRFLLLWDLIIFLGCLYVSIVIPLKLGFMDVYGQLEECPFTRQETQFRFNLLVLDTVTDVIFIVDLILNFLTARWAQAPYTPHSMPLALCLDQVHAS